MAGACVLTVPACQLENLAVRKRAVGFQGPRLPRYAVFDGHGGKEACVSFRDFRSRSGISFWVSGRIRDISTLAKPEGRLL